jgi:hypothetical protein
MPAISSSGSGPLGASGQEDVKRNTKVRELQNLPLRAAFDFFDLLLFFFGV